MKRKIVIDTETTGLDFHEDRIVEIGAVETIGQKPTGQTFHVYLNPGKPMPADATAVHGLTDEFLAGKPTFQQIAADFVRFVGNAPLVAHNAVFDVGMMNAELTRAGLPALPNEVVDTLALARAKHPGAPASLDALCKRYGIDTTHRTKHGALLDAELLAIVYVDILGRQNSLELLAPERAFGNIIVRERFAPLPPRLTEQDMAAHTAMVAGMSKSLWNEG